MCIINIFLLIMLFSLKSCTIGCIFNLFCNVTLKHHGLVISNVASLQEGPRFDSRLVQSLFTWSLHVLPAFKWVSSRCSCFPHH